MSTSKYVTIPQDVTDMFNEIAAEYPSLLIVKAGDLVLRIPDNEHIIAMNYLNSKISSGLERANTTVVEIYHEVYSEFMDGWTYCTVEAKGTKTTEEIKEEIIKQFKHCIDESRRMTDCRLTKEIEAI